MEEDLGNSFFEYYGKVFQRKPFCSRKSLIALAVLMLFNALIVLMLTLVTVLKEELLKKK
jgi:hypothetical protein